MPRVWTVSLGIFKPEETGNNAYDFTALISFGVGGCVQLVEVDWVNGAMLQLPANAIDVVARQYNNQPPGYVIGATSDGIELSVTVAHGAIGTPSATRSIHFYLESTAVPASAYTFIKIPPFARYFIPVQGYQGNGLVTGADIEYVQCGSSWAGGGGPTVLTQTKGDTLFNFGGVVPLVPMAKYLRVANASAADVVSGVIVFGLAY